MSMRFSSRDPGTVNMWLDDPGSGENPEGGTLLRVPAPAGGASLPWHIDGASPPPDLYPPGTSGFLYWNLAASLQRAQDFWSARLPDQSWHPELNGVLPAVFDEGEDLNAYYNRRGLNFYHYKAGNRIIYSGESPDVVCHEFGHGLLDALRPELFDAASFESMAFHESFGDMSALLVALQVRDLRESVLRETGGSLYRPSRLSRIAEQMGWAIRQIAPDGVEADCMRSAINSFFYQSPSGLPTSAPSSQLASEPHSFSRVFTGAFFEAMALLFDASPSHDEASLAAVGVEMADLLLQAVKAAPIVTSYFAQLGAHMVAAANARSADHGEAIRTAMVRHGILSVSGVAAVAAHPEGATEPRAMSTPRDGLLPTLDVDARALGLPITSLKVHAAAQPKRFGVAGAATSRGDVRETPPTDEALEVVEDLLRRGRLDTSAFGRSRAFIAPTRGLPTHTLVRGDNGAAVLKRLRIDCGFWLSPPREAR